MSRPLSRAQIWRAPVGLAVLSLVGLLSALLADGAGDALSWVCLAVPIAVAARFWIWQSVELRGS